MVLKILFLCLYPNSTVKWGHAIRWVYRRSGVEETVPKENFLLRDILMGATVWWVLWHLYHQPGHIIGEYEYPDPSKWTDAELGIPPDDE